MMELIRLPRVLGVDGDDAAVFEGDVQVGKVEIHKKPPSSIVRRVPQRGRNREAARRGLPPRCPCFLLYDYTSVVIPVMLPL